MGEKKIKRPHLASLGLQYFFFSPNFNFFVSMWPEKKRKEIIIPKKVETTFPLQRPRAVHALLTDQNLVLHICNWFKLLSFLLTRDVNLLTTFQYQSSGIQRQRDQILVRAEYVRCPQAFLRLGLFLPSSALTPASAGLSLALILISPTHWNKLWKQPT
jgi:hypothetical protein